MILKVLFAILLSVLTMNTYAQTKKMKELSRDTTETSINEVKVDSPHKLHVTQKGKGNSVSVTQVGEVTDIKGNAKVITDEQGNVITYSQSQSGEGAANENAVNIRQSGKGNRASVNQKGSGGKRKRN